MDNFNKFYNQQPMKYYQPADYNSIKAQNILSNINNNYIATMKWDGEWCRLIIDENQIIAQSRNVSKVTGQYGDKTALIPHIINSCNVFPKYTVLLGELCFNNMELTSREVGSILRCLPAKAIERQKKDKLYFKIFDCLAFDGKDLSLEPYETRFNTILNYVQNIKIDYIEMTEFRYSNFEDFLQEVLSNRGEGIVIHDKKYIYQPNGRPAWKTMKVKKITKELELPVIATIEPNKCYEGKEINQWNYWLGTYIDTQEKVKINHVPNNIDKEIKIKWEPVTKPYYMGWKNGIVVNNGNTSVRIASGLADKDREWLATEDAQNLINNGELFAVVSAMEITPDGSLRHPRLIRLRTDI